MYKESKWFTEFHWKKIILKNNVKEQPWVSVCVPVSVCACVCRLDYNSFCHGTVHVYALERQIRYKLRFNLGKLMKVEKRKKRKKFLHQGSCKEELKVLSCSVSRVIICLLSSETKWRWRLSLWQAFIWQTTVQTRSHVYRCRLPAKYLLIMLCDTNTSWNKISDFWMFDFD